DSTSTDTVIGIDLNNHATNTIRTNSSGNITLIGAGGSGAAKWGVGVDLATLDSSSINNIFAQNGNVNIQGTAGAASVNNFGVRVAGAAAGTNRVYTTGTGNVTINDVSGDFTSGVQASAAYLGWDGASNISGGTVTISAASGAVDFTGSSTPTVKSSNATN